MRLEKEATLGGRISQKGRKKERISQKGRNNFEGRNRKELKRAFSNCEDVFHFWKLRVLVTDSKLFTYVVYWCEIAIAIESIEFEHIYLGIYLSTSIFFNTRRYHWNFVLVHVLLGIHLVGRITETFGRITETEDDSFPLEYLLVKVFGHFLSLANYEIPKWPSKCSTTF